MLNWLLAHLGYVAVDTDDIARRLAGELLRLWGSDIGMLGESSGKAELQRRYMEVAMACGLPATISRQVANRAWDYVAQAQQQPVVDRTGFSFYR